MYRISLLLLLIILIPLALPFALLGAGPTVLIVLIKDRDFYWGLSNCERFPIIVLLIVLGLVINPIVWIGLTIYFVPMGIGALIEYYRNIREIEDASVNRLHDKLIQEGNFD